MNDTFDQSEYWIKRHSRLRNDPRSVGNLGRSVEENLAAERRVVEIVAAIARNLQPKNVLDLGCGYGRVSQCFTDAGSDYLGVDVSVDAIQQAKELNPAARFMVGDLLTSSIEEEFALVCVLYVFVHFVDDHAWQLFLCRALDSVAPGGALLIADQFPPERQTHGDHVKSRPLAEYREEIKQHGFIFDQSFEQTMEQFGRSGMAFKLIRRLRDNPLPVGGSDTRTAAPATEGMT